MEQDNRLKKVFICSPFRPRGESREEREQARDTAPDASTPADDAGDISETAGVTQAPAEKKTEKAGMASYYTHFLKRRFSQ